jgi:hypothetical protein
MSFPSWNTTVTTDSPNRESERISSTSGRPGHGAFDRVGHEPLDLEGPEARRVREDLHLHVGHVGHRVDGEPKGCADRRGG